MAKQQHEFCDPIHSFVRVDSAERTVIDSKPVQRLRHIHQLATAYLVYPGATHRRFEHSLGTMELAGRVYDVVTRPSAMSGEVRELCPEADNEQERLYWRRVVRLAALCHDIGHLPFSHAAEKDLLPDGWDHERFSRELIVEKLSGLLGSMRPLVVAEDVAKIAVGPKKAKELSYSPWERVLSEIIVGDAFGVDRMDYLLRDSLHTGVAYGSFGHHRLIDTLRILVLPTDESGVGSPALGVEQGGLQSAEALLMARYFMYSQVYFHRVRMIYDIHLIDFLTEWLPDDGRFPTDLDKHLSLTDNEIMAAILEASRSPSQPGHRWARRLVGREHFKVLYSRNHRDLEYHPDPAQAVYQAVRQEFGADSARIARHRDRGGKLEFPVLKDDNEVVLSLTESEVLQKLPAIAIDHVYVDTAILQEAKKWLNENLTRVLDSEIEEES